LASHKNFGQAISKYYILRSDALTGLHNRRRFQHILEAEITRQVRYGGTFSIVAIDLNDFKNLNDREGHHAGDQALILLATTLVKKTRQSDSIARCLVSCDHIPRRSMPLFRAKAVLDELIAGFTPRSPSHRSTSSGRSTA